MKTQFVFLISKAVLQSIRVIFRVNKYTHGNPWQMFNSKFKSYHFCCLTLVYAHSSCSIFLILAVCSTPSAYLSNIWLIAARQRVSDFEMRKPCSSSLNSHVRLGVFFVVIFLTPSLHILVLDYRMKLWFITNWWLISVHFWNLQEVCSRIASFYRSTRHCWVLCQGTGLIRYHGTYTNLCTNTWYMINKAKQLTIKK